MKYFFLLFIGCFLTISSQAQMNQDLWYKGEVVLAEGGIIEGELNYYSDFKHAFLQIQTGNKTFSLAPNQITSFRFLDDQLGITRQFYSLPYSQKKGKQPVMLFFELLLEGKHISVLNKIENRIENKGIQSGYHKGLMPRTAITGYTTTRDARGGAYVVEVPYETIFLVSPESTLKAYSKATPLESNDISFRKPDSQVLMELVSDRRSEIEKYISQQKLDLRKRNDLLHVIQYYNQIKE